MTNVSPPKNICTHAAFPKFKQFTDTLFSLSPLPPPRAKKVQKESSATYLFLCDLIVSKRCVCCVFGSCFAGGRRGKCGAKIGPKQLKVRAVSYSSTVRNEYQSWQVRVHSLASTLKIVTAAPGIGHISFFSVPLQSLLRFKRPFEPPGL